ncbi:MAG: hypothetical protein GQ534_02255 [Candidatus Delongbacteria bacterium]|nr:hypothetical protein [Candidatus Delongbacteria bacterium]
MNLKSLYPSRPIAIGSKFSIASPHYLSSTMGMSRMLKTGNMKEASLSCLLSLQENLPHLCGFGGDCLISIVDGCNDKLITVNGTGSTGSKQTLEYYRTRYESVPLRGFDSLMIYGTPSALDFIVRKYKLNIEGILSDLEKDFNKNLIITPKINYFVSKFKNDIENSKHMDNWRILLDDNLVNSKNKSDFNIYDIIKNEGFRSFYSGQIMDRLTKYLYKNKNYLFSERDFIEFREKDGEYHEFYFNKSKLRVHSGNCPWVELVLYLKTIEYLGIEQFENENSIFLLCKAYEAVVEYIKVSGIEEYRFNSAKFDTNILNYSMLEVVKIIKKSKAIISQDISNTIVMTASNADGDLIGITNSIFTPFGSCIDPDNLGFFMSNRARGFSLDYKDNNVIGPNKKVLHTINVINITKENGTSLILGTTGGYSQIQTLAQILIKILHQNIDPQTAIDSPRFFYGNVSSKKTNENILFVEENLKQLQNTKNEFNIQIKVLGKYSSRMGVTQMSGYISNTKKVFSCTDPRGDGISLAI